MQNENLSLWQKAKKAAASNTQPSNLGNLQVSHIFFTSIVEKATEIWGPFGEAWRVTDESFHVESGVALYTANLVYPELTIKNVTPPQRIIPIHADAEVTFRSGPRAGTYNHDWSRQVSQEALLRGLAKLGFAADLFSKELDSRHFFFGRQEEDDVVADLVTKISEARAIPNLTSIRNKYSSLVARLAPENQQKIKGAFNSRSQHFQQMGAQQGSPGQQSPSQPPPPASPAGYAPAPPASQMSQQGPAIGPQGYPADWDDATKSATLPPQYEVPEDDVPF